MKERIIWSGLTLVVVFFLGAWGYGELAYPRTNPPKRFDGTILSPASDQILGRSCFDCHSNETRYPWYAGLPVASLILGNHIQSGRDKLNFSLWDQMDAQQQRKRIEETVEDITKGRMPPLGYDLLHAKARVSPNDLAVLEKDASQVYGISASELTGGKEEREHGKEEEERD